MQFPCILWPELIYFCGRAPSWDICPTLLSKGHSAPAYMSILPQLHVQVNVNVDLESSWALGYSALDLELFMVT